MAADVSIGTTQTTAEQRIRDGLVALADFLTDRDDYDIPEQVIAALCPGVDERTTRSCFRSLLLFTARRGEDRTRPLPGSVEVDLDYMTGER